MVQITSLSDESISFDGKDGETVTLSLADDVKYLTVGEDGVVEGSAADFSSGDYVSLKISRGDGDGPIVNAIVLAPEDFDPENRPERPEREERGERIEGEKAGGEVTSISDSSITVTNQEGESSTFAITADTDIHSKDGVEVGDIVGIKYSAETGEALCINEGRQGRQNGPGGQGGPGGNGGPGGQQGPQS